MRILLVLALFAVVALVSSASTSEKYNDNQNVRPVLNMDSNKSRTNSARHPIRDHKANKDYNQGIIVMDNQPNHIASRNSGLADHKDFENISNNYRQGTYNNYRGENAGIWDLYHSKNLDTWRKMQSGSQEKYGQFDVISNGRYRELGRHGLGFEQRTATSYGLRAPLTLNQLQVVGKGEGRTNCRCS